MSNLNHSVKSISTMKSGLRLDLGERSDAYLPYSMIEERVSEGDTLVGTYESEQNIAVFQFFLFSAL